MTMSGKYMSLLMMAGVSLQLLTWPGYEEPWVDVHKI